MIDHALIKAAIVSRVKSNSTLVAQLPDGLQGVRESEWKGVIFGYPHVRIALETQTDLFPDNDCTSIQEEWSIYVFSEKQSSQEADALAYIALADIENSSFTQNGIKFTKVKILESIPAVAQDERTWRAQVRCRSILSQ